MRGLCDFEDIRGESDPFGGNDRPREGSSAQGGVSVELELRDQSRMLMPTRMVCFLCLASNHHACLDHPNIVSYEEGLVDPESTIMFLVLEVSLANTAQTLSFCKALSVNYLAFYPVLSRWRSRHAHRGAPWKRTTHSRGSHLDLPSTTRKSASPLSRTSDSIGSYGRHHHSSRYQAC